MAYDHLIDTYETERLKTLSVWSMFADEDLAKRPGPLIRLDRSPLEHMVHQCMGENKWFCDMLGIDVGAPPLPETETRLEFIKRYAVDSEKRLAALKEKGADWWEEAVSFFDVKRTRAWILVRRIAHTAHHRGEQTALLRMLGREVHSVYGPSAFSGGLPVNGATTVYTYPDVPFPHRRRRERRPQSPPARPGRQALHRTARPPRILWIATHQKQQSAGSLQANFFNI